VAARLKAGDEVGGFRLGHNLHRGGMAMLWSVTHPDHDPLPMIMKVPIVEYGEGPGAIVGFEVEQMILPRLCGPHVPRFVASADFTDQAFIVMERLDGSSLLPVIDEAPLAPERVATIGAEVATALHDLHRQHVLHLDLKPSNVMRRASGEAVLIDFGLSRHDQLPDLLAEEFHLPLGTAPYIAPEQVLGDRTDPRSDLFALGVMLYLFATGSRPFGNPGGRQLKRRLWRDPHPPRRLNPAVPPWLQEVILACLEAEPGNRPATAAQVALALRHPEQVPLTERAERVRRAGLRTVAGRWFKAIGREPTTAPAVARHLASAPIIMAAVDLAPDQAELADALRLIVRRILAIEPGARLACVNVLRTARLAVEFGEDEQGRSLHVRRLVELKHWARPLGLTDERVTYAVLESPDPADALLTYARQAHVDHIAVGARAASAVRRFLGSTSSRIVAEAPCNVTVVRARAPGEAPWNEPPAEPQAAARAG
jgi:non-specific serine/threonine protein kinase